ncbi:hypothetical protein FFZ96_12765 [Leptospira borgpetersenii]|nr:hypothetical protein LBHB_15825 [Leptospira borgpetersenii serovar Hardjo]TQE55516.1 hypothetical protein FFZ96_12765 [Leptospira borgpetersenii]
MQHDNCFRICYVEFTLIILFKNTSEINYFFYKSSDFLYFKMDQIFSENLMRTSTFLKSISKKESSCF